MPFLDKTCNQEGFSHGALALNDSKWSAFVQFGFPLTTRVVLLSLLLSSLLSLWFPQRQRTGRIVPAVASQTRNWAAPRERTARSAGCPTGRPENSGQSARSARQKPESVRTELPCEVCLVLGDPSKTVALLWVYLKTTKKGVLSRTRRTEKRAARVFTRQEGSLPLDAAGKYGRKY